MANVANRVQRAAVIQGQLDRARVEVDRLERELAEAHKRGESIKAEVAHQVIERFKRGEWVAGIYNRIPWWHSEDQIMIERVTSEEWDALCDLQRAGIIERD